MKQDYLTNLQKLAKIRMGEQGTVSYIFEDGSRLSQPINQEIFYTDKGKQLDLTDVLSIFKDAKWDNGAIKYSIN